ncbi:MAG: aminotransferase class III-fold pyridoxal phosphate-dependent enzyme [Negativicutes bacterium]|nr:aminotransferase class III-fold pyridoxal phosphate-dependent enzyme [Negativicutes bacterium]
MSNKTAGYYQKGREMIPGGGQLLSKRPEMFLPGRWPAYYKSARGVKVIDLDGREYVDMGMMGIGACVLGYADPDVDQAAKAAIDGGVQCTLNPPEEVELAELLCELHPWAEMARFTRSGGEAMAVAVRIARAATGRDKVAFCGYHGWSDWYLAANLNLGEDGLGDLLMPGLPPRGVPRGLAGSAHPFHYNNLAELEGIIDREGRERIAAIILEPQRGHDPAPGFLPAVRKIATRIGAVLIFDEITTGFRASTGGIHLLHQVDPDLAVFAKAMANGYAMAAVIGRRSVMDWAQATFISSTNWTERIGPAAALATIKKLITTRACEHIAAIGERWREIMRRCGSDNSFDLTFDGLPALSHFAFADDDQLLVMSVFTRLMLERGWLTGSQFKPSLAHDGRVVDRYAEACSGVMRQLGEIRDRGQLEQVLDGPPARRGFYRLT